MIGVTTFLILAPWVLSLLLSFRTHVVGAPLVGALLIRVLLVGTLLKALD